MYKKTALKEGAFRNLEIDKRLAFEKQLEQMLVSTCPFYSIYEESS